MNEAAPIAGLALCAMPHDRVRERNIEGVHARLLRARRGS